MADPVAEAAVRSCQDPFATDQAGIADKPLGHQIRVLDEVGAVADDAWN